MLEFGGDAFERVAHHVMVPAAAAASVLSTTVFAFQRPISTAHTIGEVKRVGAARRVSVVCWGPARDIAGGWVLPILRPPPWALVNPLKPWRLRLV